MCLNVTQKSEVTEDLECGVSVVAMYMEYEVGEQMVSVLEKQSHLFCKAKLAFQKYSSSCDVEGTSCCGEVGSRELIKPAKQANLGKTVMKWYKEQNFCTSTCIVLKDGFVFKNDRT